MTAPSAWEVLELAMVRGCVSFDELEARTGVALRLAQADHVTRISTVRGQTFWKSGPGAADEARVYTTLDRAGLADFHPLVVSASDDPLLGTAQVPGTPLGDLDIREAPGSGAFVGLGQKLAVLGAVVGNNGSDYGVLDAYLEPPVAAARYLSRAQLQVIAAVQASDALITSMRKLAALPTSFAHGDARPENIFVEEGVSALIDWELGGPRWPFFDVATVVAHIVWHRMIPSLAEPAESIHERVAATKLARIACRDVLAGFGWDGQSVADPVAFALVHLAFEGAAIHPALTPRIQLVLAMAERVARDDREWRLLLLPLET